MTYAVNEPPFRYNHITTATTTTIKSLPGILHVIQVSTPGTTNTVTVSDGASTIATFTAATGTYWFDVGFSSLSVTTSATCDITVSFS